MWIVIYKSNILNETARCNPFAKEYSETQQFMVGWESIFRSFVRSVNVCEETMGVSWEVANSSQDDIQRINCIYFFNHHTAKSTETTATYIFMHVKKKKRSLFHFRSAILSISASFRHIC